MRCACTCVYMTMFMCMPLCGRASVCICICLCHFVRAPILVCEWAFACICRSLSLRRCFYAYVTNWTSMCVPDSAKTQESWDEGDVTREMGKMRPLPESLIWDMRRRHPDEGGNWGRRERKIGGITYEKKKGRRREYVEKRQGGRLRGKGGKRREKGDGKGKEES